VAFFSAIYLVLFFVASNSPPPTDSTDSDLRGPQIPPSLPPQSSVLNVIAHHCWLAPPIFGEILIVYLCACGGITLLISIQFWTALLSLELHTSIEDEIHPIPTCRFFLLPTGVPKMRRHGVRRALGEGAAEGPGVVPQPVRGRRAARRVRHPPQVARELLRPAGHAPKPWAPLGGENKRGASLSNWGCGISYTSASVFKVTKLRRFWYMLGLCRAFIFSF